MNISKINFAPAFRGYINIRAYEIKNGKNDFKNKACKNISANDIRSIEEQPYSHEKCIINTRDGKEYVYYYDYPDYNSERFKVGKGRLTDLNTVLNAYMAAKMSDDDFVVVI